MIMNTNLILTIVVCHVEGDTNFRILKQYLEVKLATDVWTEIVAPKLAGTAAGNLSYAEAEAAVGGLAKLIRESTSAAHKLFRKVRHLHLPLVHTMLIRAIRN